MPSIPQSLLWIALVVLWLFVLVPMLINKRDTVRRTSDVALSTRVLNGGMRSRLLRRSGPAAGHDHDPDWRDEHADPDGDVQEFEAGVEAEDYEEALHAAVREAGGARAAGRTAMMVLADPAEADTEPVYLDVDVVEENSGALPVGAGVQQSLFGEAPVPAASAATGAPEAPGAPEAEQSSPEPVAGADPENDDPTVGEYEYVEDTSGLEAEVDFEADRAAAPAPRSNRVRRRESGTAAAVEARKYRFRKRVLTAMAAIMVLTAVLSFTVSAELWWSCGVSAAVTVLYLAYLRRQTRIEEQVRHRRQQRMARFRAGEAGYDERGSGWAPEWADGGDVPSRSNRPGAVVLDIDDEDPVFEHLDEMPYSRRYDLPRASGQ